MASIKYFLCLLPCLLLAACNGSTSDSRTPAMSGKAAPARTASAVPASNPMNATAPTTAPANTSPSKQEAPSQGATVEGSLPAPVATLPGVTCTQQRKDWTPECSAGEYRIVVNMEGCSGDGLYGQILTGDKPSASLGTGFPPFPTGPVAKLHDMQFVCIAATARKQVGEPLWYYVMAIPAESVAACKHSKLCGDPGIPKVEWVKAPPQGACRFEHGRYADCAAGWVSASDFAEFSMGL